jgi:pimeloyl-ACP methyl ester carboxylesterase
MSMRGKRGIRTKHQLALAATLVAACVVPPSAGAVSLAGAGAPATERAISTSIPWGPCNPPRDDLQCARVRVPLDWDRPKGRTISLAVIRLLASNQAERIGTFLINPGGPGDTGVGLISGDPEGIGAIGDGRFDVVSWDTRGTHRSTPRLRCFRSRGAEQKFWAGASVPTSQAAAKRTVRRARALAERCGRLSGWLMRHLSTADTARDMDHLRKLVGEEKLTYVGLSYGTYLGQTYANMFPNQVRAMLLDGVVNPLSYSRGAEARLQNFSGFADAVFDQFLARCQGAGPPRCALAGGEGSAAERWARLFARVKRKPIPAPGANGTELSRQPLTFGRLLLSQFEPMRAPSTWPSNAQNMDAALRGDASALVNAASGFLTPAGWSGAATSAAIQCADAPARSPARAWPQVLKRLVRAGKLQGRVHFAWEWAPCASWPVRGEDNYRGPWNASTPTPILLANQTYDPNSGYANAVVADRVLGNSVLLTQEGFGHLWFQNPSTCMDEAFADYLVNLVTPPPGTVCQSDQQPFDPGFG